MDSPPAPAPRVVIRVLSLVVGVSALIWIGILVIGDLSFSIGGLDVSLTTAPRPFLVAAILAPLLPRLDPAVRDRLSRFVDGWRARSPDRMLGALTGLAFMYFVVLKIRQHQALETNAFDLALYHQALVSTLAGEALHIPLLGRSLFADHVVPVLYLLLPVYAIAPDPVTLLVVQAGIVAISAVPLYAALNRIQLDRHLSVVLCAVYLGQRSLHQGLAYDFHPEMALPGLVFSLYAAALRASWPGVVAPLVLALGVKEDVPLYLVGFGVFLAVDPRTRRFGLATVVASLGWALAAFGWWLPAAQAGGEAPPLLVERWSNWGATYGEVLVGVLTSPVRVVGSLATPSVVELLGDLVFLPVLAPVVLVAVPPILLNTLPDHPIQNQLALYYAAPALPFLVIAAAIGLERLRRRFTGKPLLLYAFAVAALARVQPMEMPRPTESDRVVLEVVAALEPGPRYAIQASLIPHAPDGLDVGVFPWGLESADVAVVDREGRPWPLSEEVLREHAEGLRVTPGVRGDPGRWADPGGRANA